ncbi:unnamed protein product [Anisakis simplex]|uniref:Uncharacterized protein n=1 Tax=Anisakis simplex TaxID=6269 RepID=A0A0M3J869_ANISI|nr:unnamed protein product [Anisakis simplex]
MGITREMLRQIPHQAASRMQKLFCCKRGTPSSDTLHVAADESAPNRSLNTTINDDANRNSNIAITDQGPVRARAQDQNQSPRTVNA